MKDPDLMVRLLREMVSLPLHSNFMLPLLTVFRGHSTGTVH
ncbi:hypothetical protein [Candidatus Foliamicus sp.]